MSEENESKFSLETILAIGLVTTILLSTILIIVASAGKETVLSAYEADAEGNLAFMQLTEMRNSLGENGDDYRVANTMSTPMLVNDWEDPHRTMLIIAGAEKPFDSAEAAAIYDFVTNKGGKVIIASNSTNAQPVAEAFGVKYFDAPVVDPFRFYEVTDDTDQRVPEDQRKLWAVASIDRDVTQMGEERAQPCTDSMIGSADISNCRTPVLFHRPTALQVLDDQTETNREVSVLAHASTPAFIASNSYRSDDSSNPILGEGKTGLVVRIDYPVEGVLDETPEGQGKLNVTGSIVFVSDHSVFANHLWSDVVAEQTGKEQCDSPLYQENNHSCWSTDSEGLDVAYGDATFKGNEKFFSALIYDMMEFDNIGLASSITTQTQNFNLVFDESRHTSGALVSPFTEAIGAVVLLTSDAALKWLIGLNLFALLAIAIMVVPEKENWRHVFDLTRFRERPNKIDESKYVARVRTAFLTKVRNMHDLTRDEFARKTPAEVMQLVRDPRLVELVSSNRSYSNDELREVIPQIRRWGK